MLASTVMGRPGPRRWASLALPAAILSITAVPGAQESPSLATAVRALHADRVQTIQIRARGADFLFGQAYDADSAWPRFNLPAYSLTIDYAAGAVKEERTRTQGENPPRGGGNQPIAQQRQVWSSRGRFAWNEGGDGTNPAGRERDDRLAADARQMWIWLTPQGFVKLAQSGEPSVATVDVLGRTKTIVTVTAPNGAVLKGTLDPAGLVERIETWLASPVLGDTLLEATFRDYQNFDGIPFPTRIVHREGGYPILDLAVVGVAINPHVAIAVPDQIASTTAADAVPPPVQLSAGIWSIPLGPRDRSVAVEFRDHIVVIEAPSSEGISNLGIRAIKAAIPGKPIRFVINTHLHFDHAGGLRTYAAEGATVVTHRRNVGYFEQMWSNPRTLSPDALARSGRPGVVAGIDGSRTFSDGDRTLVVYHYASDLHHPGMLMAYLPAERMLIEADSFNPPNRPGEEPNAMPNLVQLASEIERLRLEVDQIVPVHGRLTTLKEAQQAIEDFGGSTLWPPRTETSRRAGTSRHESR